MATCGILVPWLGIELMPPAVEALNLNCWNAREVPGFSFLIFAGSPENQKFGHVHLVALNRGGAGEQEAVGKLSLHL